jgi:phosphate transport system substrate-binding protein
MTKMANKKITSIALSAILLLSLSSCGNRQKSAELSGAGATFPLPYYNETFKAYQNATGVKVSYGGIGSGGGVRNLSDEIVDFAGSDAFLKDEEMKKMAPVVHIPTCMGAVVLAYKLNGVKDLKLTGEIIADIFAGKITKWDDARLKAVNTGINLPNISIVPVFRSDGSGTTNVFTDYLSKVNAEWKVKYGSGKSVNFPAGQAAKGNPGVAGVIGQTEGAIGYIGSEYAFAQNITYATIQNKQGEFVKPDTKSISAAATGKIPDDTRIMITNSDAKGAYPIACLTWIIVYKEQDYAGRNIQQAEATVNLLNYMLGKEAQARTISLHYAPLPLSAIEKSYQNLKSITFDGKTLRK